MVQTKHRAAKSHRSSQTYHQIMYVSKRTTTTHTTENNPHYHYQYYYYYKGKYAPLLD